MLKNERGLTLAEILIVVALVGAVAVVALPRMTSIFKVSLSASSREIAAIVKEAYNSAVMTGKVHRLVYDLKENKYWVEEGPNSHLLDTASSKEKEERRNRFKTSGEKDETGETSAFRLAKTITRKKLSLPRGVEFEDIVTEGDVEPIKTGLAYSHFFPHGLVEQTLVHLKDNSKHQFTLVILPIIGRTRMYQRYVDKKEVASESSR